MTYLKDICLKVAFFHLKKKYFYIGRPHCDLSLGFCGNIANLLVGFKTGNKVTHKCNI